MFFEEAHELLANLEKGLSGLAADGSNRASLDQSYRAAHSLKGAAAMVGLTAVSEPALNLERALGQIRSGGGAINTGLAASLVNDRENLAAIVKAEEARFRALTL
jgi:two-component system chemotaxis sensor kinase CheA